MAPTKKVLAEPRLRDGDATREKLLRAALDSFSTRGFAASTTRQIEEDAGVKRGLIGYHFRSKQELWEAAASQLMDVAKRELREVLRVYQGLEGQARFRYFVRAYVEFCARHPELNRLMIQEGARNDPRLSWLVKHAVKPWYEQVCLVYDQAAALGLVQNTERYSFYYILTGAATLMFSNAAEAKLLTGKNVLDEARVSSHADALARVLIAGGEP